MVSEASLCQHSETASAPLNIHYLGLGESVRVWVNDRVSVTIKAGVRVLVRTGAIAISVVCFPARPA